MACESGLRADAFRSAACSPTSALYAYSSHHALCEVWLILFDASTGSGRPLRRRMHLLHQFSLRRDRGNCFRGKLQGERRGLREGARRWTDCTLNRIMYLLTHSRMVPSDHDSHRAKVRRCPQHEFYELAHGDAPGVSSIQARDLQWCDDNLDILKRREHGLVDVGLRGLDPIIALLDSTITPHREGMFGQGVNR